MVAKGILLEVDGRKGVILTPQGEFKRITVPAGTWGVGDEVSAEESRQTPWLRWGMVAAAAVMMLLVAPGGYRLWWLAQPAAIVTVDINPSVQLTLNGIDAVIKAQALNADGSEVLNQVTWHRRPVAEVVSDLTAQAVETGMLDPSNASASVIVAVSSVTEEPLQGSEQELIVGKVKAAATNTVASKARDKKIKANAQVAALAVTVAEKKEADARDITPGKLVIYKKMQEAAPQVEFKVEDLRKTAPGQMAKELGINLGSILHEVEEEHAPKPDKDDEKGKPDDKKGSERPGDSRPVSGQPAAKDGDQSDKGKEKGPDSSGRPGQGKKNEPAPADGQGKGKIENKDAGDENKGGRSGTPGKNDDRGKSGAKEKGGQGSDDKQGKAWKVPFLGIEIPKPSFLRGGKDGQSEAPSKDPRAPTPGAGASEDEGEGESEAEAKDKAEFERKQKELDAQLRQIDQARRQAESDQKLAEEARRKAEREAERAADERRKAESERKQAEEERRKSEEERQKGKPGSESGHKDQKMDLAGIGLVKGKPGDKTAVAIEK